MMPATEQTLSIGQQIEALQAQYRHFSSEITPIEDQIERLEAELADLRELRSKVHRQIRELALESLTPHIDPAPGPEEAFPDELIGNILDPLRDFGRRKEQQLLDEIRSPDA